MDLRVLALVLCAIQVIYCQIGQDECDHMSDSAPCGSGQICLRNQSTGKYTCREAVECDAVRKCGTPGTLCVTDYCQPPECNAIGQCVTGHVCSQKVRARQCVYPVRLHVEEKAEYKLNFEEPARQGPYVDITWYKGSTYDRIAFFKTVFSDNKPQYDGDYCSGSSPCNVSTKGELNTTTGNLTINRVELSDEDFYYYTFFIPGVTDTGVKYEYHLEVYVKPQAVNLEGIPDETVQVGTILELNCTVERIKPNASDIYWTINGKVFNGTITTVMDSDGTSMQYSELSYDVTKEDEGKPIKCTVVPVYGETVEQEQIVKPGYGPSGKPNLQPNVVEQYEGERVTLTCNKPLKDGNPDCKEFSWTKIGENPGSFQNETRYTFFMNESYVGNYTCNCKNQYNASEESNVVEVKLPGTAQTDSQSGEAGATAAIIGGAVGGVVFIILIVAIIGIFILRRRKKPKAVPDDESRLAQNNGYAQPEEPTYAQPNRKLRPQRGLNDALPGPQYMNSKELQGENAYENTSMDNNNPPPAKQNGITPEVVYTEVNIGKNDGENGTKPNKRGKPGLKPKPKERSSIKKPKVHQSEDSTVYAEIQPVKKDEQQ